MLSESERAKMLVSWNPRREAAPERNSVKELIEEQVARTPDATAVVFADERLTFAEVLLRRRRLVCLRLDFLGKEALNQQGVMGAVRLNEHGNLVHLGFR